VNRSAIALFDETGRIEFANPAWQAIACDREVVAPHVRAALLERRHLDVELAIGGRTWSAAIYPFDRGAVVCIETGERALGQRFVEVVSHELRSPIATMSLWVDVLRVATTDDVRARAATAIADSCAAQTQLVGELLDLSRALAGRLIIDRRPVAVDPLIRESLDATTRVAVDKQILFEHSIAEDLGHLTGDENRIRQILVTLIDTAMGRTPSGGVVTVSAHRTCDAIEIHIRDSSAGATAAQLATMFEPFTADVTGAFALRLALAHHLARLHEGTLVASSDGVGHGIELALKLPSLQSIT
jgi:signal transduction histidine kinase